MATNPHDDESKSNLGFGSRATGPNALRTYVRSGQITTFALIQGVVVITAIMFFFARNEEGRAGKPALILPIIGASVGVAVVCVAAIAIHVLRKRAIHNFHCLGETIATPVDESVTLTPGISALLDETHTNLIVGLAIIDGVAILNAIVYFIDGHWINLAGVAVCLVAMAAQWPTLGKRLDLIERAAQELR